MLRGERGTRVVSGTGTKSPSTTDVTAVNATDQTPIPDIHYDEIDEATRRRSFWQLWGVFFLRAGLIALALGVWWLIARLEIWPRVFVPTPLSVWRKLILTSTVHDGIRGYSGWFLWEHVWASMRRILLGSGIAIVAGVPLGLLLGSSRWMRAAFSPGITFVRSLPPLAYFSLLVIWFGIDERPKVILLLLAALPPVILATADAVFPSVLPEVITGIRVAVGFAFTTVVAAETINGMPGIGGMVRDAQRFNQTDVVILGILVIGLCGLLLDATIQLVDRLLVPWRGQL